MILRTTLIAALLTTAACKKQAPEPLVTRDTPVSVPEAPPSATPEHVQTMMANFARVYFDLDSNSLSDEAKSALNDNVQIMQRQTDVKVEVQGHADERGTTDYNLALGQKRADAVREYMTAQGVATGRVTTVSYGEERPAVSGSSEMAWSKNRRAEFRITWGTGAGTTP